jgi:hypothetical protein
MAGFLLLPLPGSNAVASNEYTDLWSNLYKLPFTFPTLPNIGVLFFFRRETISRLVRIARFHRPSSSETSSTCRHKTLETRYL